MAFIFLQQDSNKHTAIAAKEYLVRKNPQNISHGLVSVQISALFQQSGTFGAILLLNKRFHGSLHEYVHLKQMTYVFNF